MNKELAQFFKRRDERNERNEIILERLLPAENYQFDGERFCFYGIKKI